MASHIPNCVAYDPTYAYELAVIIRHGLYRMMERQEDVFFYITVMNENYTHPDLPSGVEEGIIQGMYLLQACKKPAKLHVQLMGAGTILREVREAARLLADDFSITADIWSVTSFNELRREGLAIERYNALHPDEPNQHSYVQKQLTGRKGPVIAASDYVRVYADQIRAFVPAPFVSLGTDGYGRSDTRAKLRHFFEVDAKFIVLAALNALVNTGEIPAARITDAMTRYGINPDKLDPVSH
jgi:pyruvate dehydrogenase E1 component